jgi:O-antigen/teichoic acid export membrane protein
LQYLKKISSTPLFRISSLNSVSVLVRIAGGLVASKIIALFIGPAGLALVGNFRNFLTSIDNFSTLGFQNGIIKYVAENDKDEQKLRKIITTVFVTVLAAILLISTLLLLISGYWSRWIFSGTTEFAWVFKVLAFSLPWYTGNLIIMAVLNGLGKYKNIIFINIWGNSTGVLLSALLIWKLHMPGALLGLIVSPLLMFVISFYLLKKQMPGLLSLKLKAFDPDVLKGLFSYSLMSLFTAVLGPVVYLSIRNNLISNVGQDEAGFWEAINRISSFYLMFVSTLLTVYFLPNLAMAKDNSETRKVFRSYYKGVVPLFAIGLIVIFFMREFIVKLLFTSEFVPMTNLFFWQLLGDFLKVCTLILGYEFFAKKMTRAFIVFETLSFMLLYFASNYFIKLYGTEGAVMAHAFNYAVLLITFIIYFRKKLFTI